MTVKSNVLKLDLQFFNDEEVVRGGYNPDDEIEFSEVSNPLLEDEAPETPEEPEAIEEPEPRTFDFGGRIVDPNNPETIEGAFEDFQNSQRYIQQLIQENRALQERQQFQQQQFQQQPQQPEPQEPEVDEETLNEQLMEKFYDNPNQFFKELREQAIQEARKDFEPVLRERHIQSEIDTLGQKYGNDFYDSIPQLQQMVETLGEEEVDRLGLERVYQLARNVGQPQQQQQQQIPTPDQLANDPNFLQNYIFNNEQVQQQFLQNYMNNKPEAPRVMGRTPGGNQTLANENKPKSISEASKMLRKQWGI